MHDKANNFHFESFWEVLSLGWKIYNSQEIPSLFTYIAHIAGFSTLFFSWLNSYLNHEIMTNPFEGMKT